MTARLRDKDVRVTVLDDNAYRAIDRAADRLRRGVTRYLAQRREWIAESAVKGGVS